MSNTRISDLECPQCHEQQTKVIDSRGGPLLGKSIRRRRECLQCGCRFTSYETHEHPQHALDRIARARQSLAASLAAIQGIDRVMPASNETSEK